MILFGNRCGHQKESFKDIAFPRENNRPKVIQWCLQRLRKYFYNPEKYFPELSALNTPLKSGGGHRFNRSEGRESLSIISQLLFYNLELSTMSVRLDDIVYNSPTFEQLTKNGLYLSISRARRAIAKLVKAGYITVTRQFEKSDNVYTAFASIKAVTYKFFRALGLEKYYEFSRAYKLKAIEKKASKRSKRKSRMARFDSFLPPAIRQAFFKKVGENSLQVFTGADIETMRAELVAIYSLQTTAPLAAIREAVGKYNFDSLKKMLDYHRQKKASP